MFQLDKKLLADTHFVADLKLSRLLLMNDSNYPWFILVPMKNDLSEILQLSPTEQIELLNETNLLSEILLHHFGADKINIAALGNVVRQLHIHVIGRFENDACFPRPVWGAALAKPYEEKAAEELVQKIRNLLKEGVI